MIAKFRWATEGTQSINPFGREASYRSPEDRLSIMWHTGPSLGASGELDRTRRVGASGGSPLLMKSEADQRQSLPSWGSFNEQRNPGRSVSPPLSSYASG